MLPPPPKPGSRFAAKTIAWPIIIKTMQRSLVAVHTLAERATHSYEAAREKVRHFYSGQRNDEVLFSPRGTTTSLNWVATSLGDQFCQ